MTSIRFIGSFKDKLYSNNTPIISRKYLRQWIFFLIWCFLFTFSFKFNFSHHLAHAGQIWPLFLLPANYANILTVRDKRMIHFPGNTTLTVHAVRWRMMNIDCQLRTPKAPGDAASPQLSSVPGYWIQPMTSLCLHPQTKWGAAVSS